MDVNEKDLRLEEEPKNIGTSENPEILEENVDFFNAEVLEPVKAELPFPKEDYDENGKLKTVRKGMLKKLLKYEFKSMLTFLLCAAAFLLLLAILFGVHLRLSETSEELDGWIVLTGLLYAYTNMGVLLIACIYPYTRYKKNFFSDEGYLTFSIPASAEEHLLAKHISMIVLMAIAWVAVFIGLILMSTIGYGANIFKGIADFFQDYGAAFKRSPAHTIFFTLEFLLLFLISIPFLPCVTGAWSCLTQKYGTKKKFSVHFIYGVLVFVALYALAILIFATDLYLYVFSPVGIHITLWCVILFGAGITYSSFMYERKTLKYNLNLQ